MALVHPHFMQQQQYRNHYGEPPAMIWVPQEVVVDMQALRKQVEAEVEAKYKHRLDMLNRSIDVLERENVRLNRAIVDIKKSRKLAESAGKRIAESGERRHTNLDELIARKELEFQQLGMFA